jgi:AAA15 family ATPase/GTPase
MLLRFATQNYLSFKDKQTLDLNADALKDLQGHLHIPFLFDHRARVLKSVALFGHNSHGKSNFIKAYSFFINFLVNSFNLNRGNDGIKTEVFALNTSTFNKPSFFEVEIIVKEIKYRYGFEITTEKVVSEWLFYSQPQVRENYLFIRNGQEFKINKIWNKESNNRIENQGVPFAKSQTLLLSVLFSQEDIPKLDPISLWIKGNIFYPNLADNLEPLLKNAVAIFSNEIYKSQILKFIANADLGFESIFDKIEQIAKRNKYLERGLLNMWYSNEIGRFELFTNHSIYDENYILRDKLQFELIKKESDGSIKYFILSCLFVYALRNGNLLLIDELDSRLHPLLFEVLIKEFHSNKLNTNGCQLIFTTHNTALLNKKLRRDQIVFVEKNKYGESSLRRLHTKESPVRIDSSIEKDYRNGHFGGISEKLRDYNSKLNLFD